MRKCVNIHMCKLDVQRDYNIDQIFVCTFTHLHIELPLAVAMIRNWAHMCKCVQKKKKGLNISA